MRLDHGLQRRSLSRYSVRKDRSASACQSLNSSQSSFASSRASTFTSSSSSYRSTFIATGAADVLEDWVYWQRDEANTRCWMKVYAVLQREFLWFFQTSRKGRTNLLQIAVSVVEVSGEREFRIVDPNGEGLNIWIADDLCFELWRERLEDAAELTAQYFEAFPIQVKNLPRDSCYRGSLASHRRIRKRDICREALSNLVTRCRHSLLGPERATIC